MSIAHGQRILQTGEPLATARAAMILAHGRGATAEDILHDAAPLQRAGFAYLAPQAANNTWYPNHFMASIESNEPYLSAALDMLAALLKHVEATVPASRVVLFGFSQGGCLISEFAARNAQRFGAVVALSSGLIGPDGAPRNYPGSFDDTPVFLGCSDVDPHIPKERVLETAEIFNGMGASVTARLYPGMAHTVSREEMAEVRALLSSL